MRVTRFREVLWQTARKIGLDPDKDNFLVNEAIPLGESLSQWVRRTYPSRDWPEWTKTVQVNPLNHIVPYDPNVIGPADVLSAHVFRVFNVYLVDPTTTDAPVTTDYTLREEGIHVGFDHGSSVWVKYIEPPPRFTAEKWLADQNYARDDIAYSYTTGHVYKSKVNSNVGHDPAVTFSLPPPLAQPPTQLPTEITVQVATGNPGIPAQNQIIDLFCVTSSPLPREVPNPPANLSRIAAIITDADGNTIGSGIVFPNGTQTLDAILTDIVNQLISDLGAGWTVTVDTAALSIRLSNASNFSVTQWIYSPVSQPVWVLRQTQVQSYIPLVPPTGGTSQIIEFPLTPDQVTPGATYTLTFRDLSGGKHVVNYVALDGDGAQQILAGLIAQTQSAAFSDPFFNDVQSTLDTTSPLAQFATSTGISIDAMMTLPGSPWWELVPFPTALADMCERGGYADILKEWGQTDRGTAEESQVPQEAAVSVGNYDSTQINPLTNQQKPMSRYKVS